MSIWPEVGPMNCGWILAHLATVQGYTLDIIFHVALLHHKFGYM